jgi:hypothetical protein
MQKHRHCVHRHTHPIGRLAVGEAQHVSVQHGCALLIRQIGERCPDLGHPCCLLYGVILERFRVQASAADAARGVEGDRSKPRARVARDRAALEGALRIEERRLHRVLGVVTVAQLALDESDQPAPVLPVQQLDLTGHG